MKPHLCIQPLGEGFREAAEAYAGRLHLPLWQPDSGAPLALQIGADGLQLVELRPQAAKALRVDFVSGEAAHRRQFGGGSGQMIARAVGIKGNIRPRVLDATAGLGRDAFVLASLGCPVQMLERNAVLAALLQDGLERAAQNAELAPILQRMQLTRGDACTLMQNWQGEPPEVIYLDPMFPAQKHSAAVKKDLALLRLLLEGRHAPEEEANLLQSALRLASHRVSVKRPRKAPPLGGIAPALRLEGKSCRFDLYPKQKLTIRCPHP